MELDGRLDYYHTNGFPEPGGLLDLGLAYVIPLDRVEDKDKATIYHVPFIEWHVIDLVRDPWLLWNANGGKHRLLPEATASFDCGDGVDNA